MELTGKCKLDFEKWFWFNSWDEIIYHTNQFYNLPIEMQYGVYVNFFDGVGIDADAIMISIHKYYSSYTLKPLSRLAAIKKANEIYNK